MNSFNKNEAGAEYANILADTITGKNFEVHYRTVTQKIAALNRSIDSKPETDEDYNWIIAVCYHYYRLQELIREESLTQTRH